MATDTARKEQDTTPVLVDKTPKKEPSPQEKEPSLEHKESSPKEQDPFIYTQTQADALVNAAKMEAGRTMKDVEKERDTLKTQITNKERELEDIQDEKDSVQTQIDDLTSDDPKKFDLVKKERDLRTREREAKNKLTDLDTRETNLSEREKKVNAFELEAVIETIVDEYEDGDSGKLKKAISVLDNPTEEHARNIADAIFSKKEGGEEKKGKVPKTYSGKSDGGSAYFTRTQIADRKFWEENKDAIMEAQTAGRIKDE